MNLEGRNPLHGTYAILLAPYFPPATCAADVNGDGVVNVVDMLAVINAWGVCSLGTLTPCPADINTDFVVNVADLLALIAAWGSCDSPEEAPQSVEDCQTRCSNYFGSSGAEYTDCVSKCISALCETGVLPPEDCPE